MTADFIISHRLDDVRTLALQQAKYPDVDMRYVVTQISGWQVARRKLPLWAKTDGVVYPVHLSMEQCSSQTTAAYKATVIESMSRRGVLSDDGLTLTDLTCGYGVDATMMGRVCNRLRAVERNDELCDIVRHNLPLLGVDDAEVVCGDGVEVLQEMEHCDVIFLDPARRDSHGAKVVAIEDCTPDVIALQSMLLDKADLVMIKLSPMLDLASAIKSLTGVCEVHIVSVDGECKELLFCLTRQAVDDIRIIAVNLSDKAGVREERVEFDLSAVHGAECHYTDTLGRYLYEPNASVMKATGFKPVAEAYGLDKLHPSTHLYTSDKLLGDFPGRVFEIVGWASFNKKELKSLLGSIKKANITVRNFPSTVADLRKRLKLNDGGDDYLFAATLADETKVLIRCQKVFVK